MTSSSFASSATEARRTKNSRGREAAAAAASAFLGIAVFLLLPQPLNALDYDGIILLSFKSSILSDPLSILRSWNHFDDSPCQWRGVTCSSFLLDDTNSNSSSSPSLRVTALALPASRLLGSISGDLGLLPHLRHLDLSDNFLNGTLPDSLFNATALLSLSLSNNELSGALPPLVANLHSLQALNLSDNALTGHIPAALTFLPNLTLLCLRNNYFSGGLPAGGFDSLRFADLSSNLINGSLPRDFAGGSLRTLNLSYNRLSGGIALEFVSRTPANASLDLSFNNLTGEIPATGVFLNQKADAFAGNPDLCGKPLKSPCSIPSTLSTPPNVSSSTSPLAIAAIPKTLGRPSGDAATGNATQTQQDGGLRPGTIAGIVVGDLAGIGVVSMFFLYLYQARKKPRRDTTEADPKQKVEKVTDAVLSPSSSSSSSSPTTVFWLRCLTKKRDSRGSNDEETTESETEEDEQKEAEKEKEKEEMCDLEAQEQQQQQRKSIGGGTLVTVDGESKLELETLLKASAYVLGATGPNIVYKAVLEDGTTFAVRRMGESGGGSLKDFENQVRLIAKLRHPNILPVRGFYWGSDDKLVIFDYAPNGSLGSAYLRKQGSIPCHLSWDARIRIARGVARGLMYLHEKKYVHGNLKPSNILLGADMEPKISDFGMNKLALGDNLSKGTSGSAREFGSKQSSLLQDNHQDIAPTGANPSVSTRRTSPYHAPESLKSLKPNPKWDVYSFGIVFLELLSGKVFSDGELSGSIGCEWSVISGENRVLKMTDVAVRDDLEGKEEALLGCFKLGFSCASVNPQKRPSMKETLELLDKIPA